MRMRIKAPTAEYNNNDASRRSAVAGSEPSAYCAPDAVNGDCSAALDRSGK